MCFIQTKIVRTYREIRTRDPTNVRRTFSHCAAQRYFDNRDLAKKIVQLSSVGQRTTPIVPTSLSPGQQLLVKRMGLLRGRRRMWWVTALNYITTLARGRRRVRPQRSQKNSASTQECLLLIRFPALLAKRQPVCHYG